MICNQVYREQLKMRVENCWSLSNSKSYLFLHRLEINRKLVKWAGLVTLWNNLRVGVFSPLWVSCTPREKPHNQSAWCSRVFAMASYPSVPWWQNRKVPLFQIHRRGVKHLVQQDISHCGQLTARPIWHETMQETITLHSVLRAVANIKALQ